ncbi:hypothetical protein N9I82_00620 [Alphaproteobacteria bacterium]|nr:hypothetical protein [Alphaproteobacteria bacterium]
MSQDYTIEPTKDWVTISEGERKELVNDYLQNNDGYNGIIVERASDNGHVVLRIEHGISASERGLFLLDLEEKLKQSVDIGVTIWLEPVGDKSKLRQLRGVEVKS